MRRPSTTTMRPCSTRTSAASRPRPSILALRPAASSRCVAASDRSACRRRAHGHPDVARPAVESQDRGAEMVAHAFGASAASSPPPRGRRPRAAGCCGAMSTTVTSLPSRRNACAISHADGTAADHEQRRHRLAQVEHRLVGEIGCRVDARQSAARSGRDPVAITNVRAVRRRPFTSKASGATKRPSPNIDVDAEPAKALRAVVGLDVLDHGGDALHHRGEIGPRIGRRQRPAIRMAHLVGDPRRLQQRLRRNAAVTTGNRRPAGASRPARPSRPAPRRRRRRPVRRNRRRSPRCRIRVEP